MKNVYDHPPEYRPYQVTFSYYLGPEEDPADNAHATLYRNFTPNEMSEFLGSVDEDYHDRGFNISSITVRYTTSQVPHLM